MADEHGPFRVCAESDAVRAWAIPGSYPAAIAAEELACAGLLIPVLAEILGCTPSLPIEIVLVEPPPDMGAMPAPDPAELPVLRLISQDGSVPPLAFVLAQHLVAITIPGAVRHRALVGLAVLAESRIGLAPPLEVLDGEVNQGEDPLRGPGGWASLAAFTIEQHGHAGLVNLLVQNESEPTNPDAAPPAELIEPWLKWLTSGRTKTRGWHRMTAHLKPFLRLYRWRLLELLSYMLLTLVFTIGLPLASRYLIDGVLPSGSTRLLVIFILVMLAVSVYHAGLEIRTEYASTQVNLQIFRSLQLQMFTNLQRLSHDYYGRSRIGDIMSRMQNDLALVQQTAGQVLGGTVSAVLTFVAAVIAISALSPYVGLSVLVALPFIALAYRIYGRQLATASLALQEQIGDTQSHLQQSLSAHEVTKAFRAEEHTVRSFGERVTRQSRATLRLTLLGGKMGASIGLANGLPQLGIMGIGGYLVMTGRLSLGVLVALLGLVPSVFSPITSLSGIAQSVRQATGAMTRVVELLDENPSVVDHDNARTASRCTSDITFSHVSFAYPTGRLVLDDITLTIPAGSRVAIVGASGCGKSTMLSLLARFWDPSVGSVAIDGQDVRGLTLNSLRGQIGLVLQDTFVFDATLRENVAIGRPDASDDEIMRALHAAELTAFVDALPDGLDTRMGESTRASGGQRQRLAFARVLLLDPSIIALDEPTSALDSETERALLETMATVAQGRTTIMVTHRLAAAADMDLIVVMEAGRIAEMGTHDELLAAGGAYSRLFDGQTAQRARTVDTIQIDALKRSMLFGHASRVSLDELAAALEVERFDAGDDVVRAGDIGDRLFVVASGELDVMVHDEGGGTRTVNHLRDGDVFGELALLGAAARTATVRAATPVLLWSLSMEAMTAVATRHPDLRAAVNQGLNARVEAYQFARAANFAKEPQR